MEATVQLRNLTGKEFSMKQELFVYTRIPDDSFCPPEYGNSIHIAVSVQGGTAVPLNKNEGILYAAAEISRENQIIGKSLAEPVVVPLKDGEGTDAEYAILAKRIGHDGTTESTGGSERLLWLTKDFISFEECGMVDVTQHHLLCEIPIGKLSPDKEGECIYPFPDVSSCSRIEIGTTLYETIMQYYMPIQDKNAGCSREWPAGSFPLASGFADPVIFLWNDKYYYIATNDNTGDIGFFVREADQIPDLFLPDTPQHLILDQNAEKSLVQTFWAPEFHVIGGRVYLLFAVSGDTFDPQCHMMRLKEHGLIICAEDWEEPVRVRKKDGTFLGKKGITLDMTHFSNNGNSYLVWSYRENCMAEGDTGSMLYIASTDPDQPWCLTSDPVLLSRPLYGWENVAGTINNEGPYPLITDDNIYITYSGGSACNWTYAVGLLSIGREQDPLDVKRWKKNPYPVLSTADLDGIYGPGHNSFFRDKQGNTYIAYHGEAAAYDSPRSTMLHRIHFRENGEPVFRIR